MERRKEGREGPAGCRALPGCEEVGTSGSIPEGFQGIGCPDGEKGREAAGKENPGRNEYQRISLELALQAIEAGTPSGLF
jgi:hypothetical protein